MTDVEKERKGKKKKAPEVEAPTPLTDDELLALENLSVNDDAETTDVSEITEITHRSALGITDPSELAGSLEQAALEDDFRTPLDERAAGEEPLMDALLRDEQESVGESLTTDEEDAEVQALAELAEASGESGEAAFGLEAPVDTTREHLKGLLEALVFASDKPMTPVQLARAASSVLKEVKPLLAELKEEYATRGIQLDEVAGGWIFRTKAIFAPFVRDMTAEKPVRLSRAQLETLAILAYRQPVTRPEIDDIRGVDCGAVLKLLLERDLIRMMGKKEEPGRPILYGTTTAFLEFFGLKSLKDLPTLKEFTELNDDSKRIAERELGEVLEERQVPAARVEEPAPATASSFLDRTEAEEAVRDAEESESGALGEDGASGEAKAEEDESASGEGEGGKDEAEDENDDEGVAIPALNADDEAEFPDDDDDDFDDDEDEEDDDEDDAEEGPEDEG